MKFSWTIVLMMLTIPPFGFAPEKSDSVVVVELFTSQGCSSCPSADKLLNEIILQSEKDHKPVIGLSYHVSYWNYLGWKDPYSNEYYNTIQQQYANALNSAVYTPQMVINGQAEFIGSDRS